jgi:citrate lyase subunit beta / citryl-CoA lyase
VTRECRIRHTPDRAGFLTTLSLCVLAARAHGLEILDGVHLDLDDEAGLARHCAQGRDLGFDGKTLIHPKQLSAANAAFAPAPEAIVRARRIIEAWQQASAAGKAVVVVDGRLIENLHVQEAERDLELAERISGMGW